MILRFTGGPLDGLEEESEDAPHSMLRSPPVSVIMRALETARRGEEPPDFCAVYELAEVYRVAGTAVYRVAD